MSGGYAIGETEFECWGRLGKTSPSDPDVDAEEWVTFLERIEEHFRCYYESFPDEFYFWGDFSGDRTLDVKIAKRTILTARLLSDLQKNLRSNGEKLWRIRIPIYFKANDPQRVVVAGRVNGTKNPVEPESAVRRHAKGPRLSKIMLASLI